MYSEKTINSKHIYRGKILNLRLDEVELPNGHNSMREIVEHPGAVAIVAITPENKVLLIKQYRKACEQVLWEIPAGKMEFGENPEDTAIRELTEETGYIVGSIQKLISFYTSPGFANELLHIYLAENLTTAQQNLDDDEFLSVHQLTWDEVQELLNSGELKDAKTVTGLLMVMARKGISI